VTTLTNWSGNYAYRAPRIHRPDSIEQLQEVVAGAERVKALGSRHCFTDIADTPGDLLDLSALPDQLELDAQGSTATVNAAANYGRVAVALQEKSRALGNMASLPHISIAGAIATGTHGSGVGNQGLAGSVAGIELVQGDGELLRLARGDRDFAGAVVHLGALGVLTRVTLDVEASYDIRQDVFENLPWTELEEHFDEILASAYSVSLFTDLQGPAVSQVWCKSRLDAIGTAVVGDHGAVVDSFYGARPATIARHPLPGLPGDVCTGQLGEPGPWNERLPHFQLAFTPSNGDELQSEYLVARDSAMQVLDTLRGMAPLIAPLLQVCEIRTVAADELWLSPAYRQDSVAFHFTWRLDEPAVRTLLSTIEAAIADYRPRPHWGKVFAADAAALAAVYPRLPDFRRLAGELDPAGVFGNDYLDRYLGVG
jgi:xylitol oxidase